MWQWISENREWVFSGVGLFIIGAIAGAFRLLKSRQSTATPSVVVHLHTPGQGHAQISCANDESASASSPIPIERIAPITPEQISKAIDEAPPLQRMAVGARFIGLTIEWDAYLRSGYELIDAQVQLYLRAGKPDDLFDVSCKVSLTDYKILRVMPEGTKLRVSGEIVAARRYEVELTNVHLSYFDASGN